MVLSEYNHLRLFEISFEILCGYLEAARSIKLGIIPPSASVSYLKLESPEQHVKGPLFIV